MNDLISRTALLNAMDKRYREKQGVVPDNMAEGFMQMEKLIKEQPTAYNEDKIVEELENERKKITAWDSDKHYIYKDGADWMGEKAIEIVKRGGVHE